MTATNSTCPYCGTGIHSDAKLCLDCYWEHVAPTIRYVRDRRDKALSLDVVASRAAHGEPEKVRRLWEVG